MICNGYRGGFVYLIAINALYYSRLSDNLVTGYGKYSSNITNSGTHFSLIFHPDQDKTQVRINTIVKNVLTNNWRNPIRVGFTFTAGLKVP